MKSSHLSVICLASLVATGRCCMVGGIWRFGGSNYDDYDYGSRGRFRNGYGNNGYGTTGFGNSGFVGYSFGLGGLGLLLSLLLHPHPHGRPPPPPPREIHHHHHYYHRDGGGYDYKYSQDTYQGSRGPGPRTSGDNKGPHDFSSFFKHMFYR